MTLSRHVREDLVMLTGRSSHQTLHVDLIRGENGDAAVVRLIAPLGTITWYLTDTGRREFSVAQFVQTGADNSDAVWTEATQAQHALSPPDIDVSIVDYTMGRSCVERFVMSMIEMLPEEV